LSTTDSGERRGRGAASDEARSAVSEVAAAVGVSPQTLRVWESKGLLVPARSPGGRRVYSQADLDRASQIALLRRRHGWNSAAIADFTAGDQRPNEQARIGAIVRSARKERSMTVADLAERVGVSRSFISAVERGESGVSFQILSRLAQALELTLAEFAPRRSGMTNEVRPQDRLVTVLAGGVTWEELAVPGHALEPALLLVPPGETCGGPISRAGENFVLVLQGELRFVLHDEEREVLLDEGAALILPPDSTWTWVNPGPEPVRAVWVEQRK
jgi:DNA-binding transcriptional MerR regulator/mannose-6-phosphate isomerase-like protein (cupin superfamily)